MFGLSTEKIIIVLAVAAFTIGPQRLPAAAARLAQLVKTVKSMADGAKDRIASEIGPEFQDTDWKKLDPRQYDPRRIIRSALLDQELASVVERPAQSVSKNLPDTVEVSPQFAPAGDQTAEYR